MQDAPYREVPVTGSDRPALVDAEDFALVARIRWHNHRGYARGGSAPGKPYMHRLLAGVASGDRRQVDHRNRDRLDNRRANLRIVTQAQNCQNTSGIYRCWSNRVARIPRSLWPTLRRAFWDAMPTPLYVRHSRRESAKVIAAHDEFVRKVWPHLKTRAAAERRTAD